MASPGQCTSILEFLQQHEGEQIASDVYFKWKDMLPDTGFDEQFRKSYDQWFQFCYRNDLDKLSNGMVAQEKTRMFEMLKTQLNHEPKLYLQYIENKFGGGEGVVDAAIRCLWREEQLLIPYIQSILGDASSINRQEQAVKTLRDSYEMCLANFEKLKAVLTTALALTETETQNSTTVTDHKNKMEDLSQRLQHDVYRDRAEQLVKKLQEECNELESANKKLSDQISLKQQESLQLFDVLLQKLTDNNGKILDAVTMWRNDFKMFYAELGLKPDLEKIAKCCAESAKLLYDIKQDGLAQLTHAFSEDNCHIQKTLDNLLLELFRGVLAADLLEHMLDGHIQAFLVHEESLNQCCEPINDSKWLFHIDRVEQTSLKLVTKKKGNAKGAESRFIRHKKTKYIEGEFSALQVEKFDRAGLQRQVYEERYKIVFVTNVGQEQLWTVSMPLVMITGSNQQCHSLASVMWACYSTNVYALPSVVPTKMSVGDIVDRMLDAKIRKLCPSRGLSEDNKEHLKKRLIGSDIFTDEIQVSLQQFCFDKMLQTADSQPLTFSFWEWFVACYNLIEKYLLQYWEKGWIVGFISRTTATAKLAAEKSCRDGLFLLRFSDSIIVPSQGIKCMFGHLTVCFTYEKVIPGGETKRGIIPDGNVADFKDLEKNCLANILSETLRKQGSTHCYRYIYPSLKRREETFDTFLESKPVVANYHGVKQLWMMDIEQMLGEETALGKRTEAKSSKSSQVKTRLFLARLFSKKTRVAKRTKRSRCKSNDTSAYGAVGNSCSSINESPPALEETSVHIASPADIPFLPEIQNFTGTPDSSSLESMGDDYGVVPIVDMYNQLTDGTGFAKNDCFGELTGTNSIDFELNITADDQAMLSATDGPFEITELDLEDLNILEDARCLSKSGVF